MTTLSLQLPRSVSATRSVSAVSWRRQLVQRLVVLDLLLAAVGGGTAMTLRFGHEPGSYRLLAVVFPLGLLAAIAASRGYEERFLGAGTHEYRCVADAAVRYALVVAALAYAAHLPLARGWVVLAFLLSTGLVLAGRYAARQRLLAARARGGFQHRIVVVGTERSTAELIRSLRREGGHGFEVVAACVERCVGTVVEGVPVLSGAHDVRTALARTGADTVAVSAWSPLTQDELRRLSWELEGTGTDLVVAPPLADVDGPRLHIRPIAGMPLLHVQEPEFRGARRLAKAGFDRGVALLALLLLAPVLVAMALAVRLSSPGPALFRQQRVGRSGRTFNMLKFRSMRVGADREVADLAAHNERAEGLLFKMREDPRVTSCGRLLRRLSLDELPQLVNVLRGQMSLVGPRPPLPGEVARYGDDVRRRLLVKPGLTGLWQVSGRSDLTWEQSVRLDLHYVENWSLGLDIGILWRTAAAVLGSRGAY